MSYPAGLVEAAYRDHAASVLGVTLRSTRDPELAADVTQEAFSRLIAETRAGRCPDNIRAWLHRTSANLVVSRARREAVARRHAPGLVHTHGPAQPDEITVHREAQHELRSALAILSAADRIAVLMSANGSTGTEIASHFGWTAGATRTRLSRARALLRAKRSEADVVACRVGLADVANPLIHTGAAA
ncbi:MAG: RNA polymerase sigma factor [Candidatus Limnocylindrales bacterium]